MRFKPLTLVAFLFFASLCAHAQTRRPTPKPSPSPQATAQPSPTPDIPAAAPQASPDEFTETERKDLQTKVLQSETMLQLAGIGVKVDVKKEPAQIAEVYQNAPRDSQLARALMSDAFSTYYYNPSQSSARLLLLQAAQNQVLIEQNKKIIQLLTELAKARK